MCICGASHFSAAFVAEDLQPPETERLWRIHVGQRDMRSRVNEDFACASRVHPVFLAVWVPKTLALPHLKVFSQMLMDKEGLTLE